MWIILDFNIKSKHILASIGQVGKILSFFKAHNVTHIILAGGVKKPNFQHLKVDLKGGILLTKILKNKFLGDNSLLTTIIRYIEGLAMATMAMININTGIITTNSMTLEMIKSTGITICRFIHLFIFSNRIVMYPITVTPNAIARLIINSYKK